MSNPETVRRQVTLAVENGLHLAPISRIVETATQFSCQIRILFDGKNADAKSVYDLMLLGATFGSPLSLEAEGQAAEDAVEAVARILECR